jgi:DNA-binding IclR family transcriptional regulator
VSDERGPVDEFDVRAQLTIRDQDRVRARRPGGRPAPATTPVGVLDRSVAILEAVADGARSLPALGDATGLTRSTVHRLTSALEEHGFLLQVGGYGYALGPRLLGLAATAMRVLPLRELARPALERLAETTGESAQLYVRDGERRVCVDAVQSEQELRTIVEVGASLPLEKGSAGLVFLAWDLGIDHRSDDRLAQQLKTARERGWTHSHAEREPGVASVSAPVFGPAGTLVAAVSVSGPASRLPPLRAKERAPAVMAAAREIEAAMGTSR